MHGIKHFSTILGLILGVWFIHQCGISLKEYGNEKKTASGFDQ
jgi:hypothetical protein